MGKAFELARAHQYEVFHWLNDDFYSNKDSARRCGNCLQRIFGQKPMHDDSTDAPVTLQILPISGGAKMEP
jgi:hypothetical protein